MLDTFWSGRDPPIARHPLPSAPHSLDKELNVSQPVQKGRTGALLWGKGDGAELGGAALASKDLYF